MRYNNNQPGTKAENDQQPILAKVPSASRSEENSKLYRFNYPSGVAACNLDFNAVEYITDPNNKEQYRVRLKKHLTEDENKKYQPMVDNYNSIVGNDLADRKLWYDAYSKSALTYESLQVEQPYQKPKYPPASLVARNANNSIYGGSASLVYPNDLIGENGGSPFYNNSYTVFFISEHKTNQFAKKKGAVAYDAFEVYNKKGWAQESNVNNIDPNGHKELYQGVNGALAYFTINKLYSNTIGPMVKGAMQSFTGSEAIAGVGEAMSNGVKQIVSLGGAAGAAFNPYINDNNLDYVQLKTCIVLPTPSIEQSNKIQWKTESGIFNAVASSLAKIGNDHNGKDVASKQASDAAHGIEPNLIGEKWTRDMKLASDAVAASILAGDQEIGGYMGRRSGFAPNPRKEQMFDDLDFRTFGFEYKMFARNKKEFETIEQIIKTFRYHALPGVVPSTFLYVYPAQFDVVHYYGNGINPHMPKHTTAVLTSIDVKYGNQDSISFQENGEPTLITINLQFQEIAIVTKRDVLEGGY